MLQDSTNSWKAFSASCWLWKHFPYKKLFWSVVLLFYATTKNHFSTGLWYGIKKWMFYDKQQWPAQWLDWEETPKHFPESNLHQSKVTVTVWWSAARLTHYSFLSPREIITSEKYAQQIDEIHWKLQCLQAGVAQQMGPILLHDCANRTSHNQHFKSWTNWVRSFVSSTIFAWPLANRIPLLQAFWQIFARKMLPQPEGGRKCFAKVCWILKHGFLCYRNELISHWQKCIACNVSYFDE